jgi:hypothetical protein
MNAEIERLARQANDAIFSLLDAAKSGDRTAIMHLHGIGECIANDLHFLSLWPDSAAAVFDSAAQSDRWPITVPAIKELRCAEIERQTPKSLGSSLTIRPDPTPGTGGSRLFKNGSRLGFAMAIWEFFNGAYACNHFSLPPESYGARMASRFLADAYLDGWRPTDFVAWQNEAMERMGPVAVKAQALPLLTRATLPQWQSLAVEWAEALCLGRWDEYGWPAKIHARSITKSSKFAKSERGKTAVTHWIKNGLASLIDAPKIRQSKSL